MAGVPLEDPAMTTATAEADGAVLVGPEERPAPAPLAARHGRRAPSSQATRSRCLRH